MGPRILLPSLRKDVIRRRTATATIAVPNNNTHHPVIRLPTARDTIVVPKNPNVIPRRTVPATTVVPNQPVSYVHMALARIAVLVIPILGVPLNVLPVETVVHHSHCHHHPVSIVLLALARIAVRVIQVLGVPLKVFPMETVVSEKNVTKSVNSLAVTTAVTVAMGEKEARVAREAITVVASEVITEEDLVVITEEDSVERVAREERVARVDTTTVDNTKYVNSFVNL